MFERSGSGGGVWLRRIAAILVAIVLSAVLFFSGVFHASSTLLSSKSSTSDQFVSAVTTASAENDIANAAIPLIEENSTPSNEVNISENTPLLEGVIKSTIATAPVQSILKADVSELWSDLKSGNPGTINLAPLIQPFLTAMHRADPSVSAATSTYAPDYNWVIRSTTGAKFFGSLSTWGWALTIIGLLGAILVARFLLRQRPVKMLALFAIVVLPGLALTLIGFGVRDATQNKVDPNSTPLEFAVVKASLGRVGSVVGEQGIVLLVIGVGIMLVWGGWWLIRNRQTPPEPA